MLMSAGFGKTAVGQEKEAYAVFDETGASLTFYYDTDKSTHNSPQETVYSVENESNWYYEKSDNIKYVTFNEDFKDYCPKSCKAWFSGCAYIISIKGLENLNTSECKDMSFMFWYSNITSLDLSSWDTKSVETMEGMFGNCRALEVINFGEPFDTQNVTTFSRMFEFCIQLKTINGLNYFNTRKCNNMKGMFNGCRALELLDLSSFNTKNVGRMNSMFDGCSSLTTIVVSDKWDASHIVLKMVCLEVMNI